MKELETAFVKRWFPSRAAMRRPIEGEGVSKIYQFLMNCHIGISTWSRRLARSVIHTVVQGVIEVPCRLFLKIYKTLDFPYPTAQLNFAILIVAVRQP